MGLPVSLPLDPFNYWTDCHAVQRRCAGQKDCKAIRALWLWGRLWRDDRKIVRPTSADRGDGRFRLYPRRIRSRYRQSESFPNRFTTAVRCTLRCGSPSAKLQHPFEACNASACVCEHQSYSAPACLECGCTVVYTRVPPPSHVEALYRTLPRRHCSKLAQRCAARVRCAFTCPCPQRRRTRPSLVRLCTKADADFRH